MSTPLEIRLAKIFIIIYYNSSFIYNYGGLAEMLTKEELIAFEAEIAQLYFEKKIPGPIHLSYNNEEALINIFANVKKSDWVFSTHRSHYHALLKGIPRDWLRDEILAGHSITINNPDYKFYASAIMGDIVAIAVGTAMGLKLKNISEHVWCFVGDMTAEMGVFHESVKYAERNDFPITFVVEDNGLSTVTPTQESWGLCPRKNKIIRYEYRNTRYPHGGIDKNYTGF